MFVQFCYSFGFTVHCSSIFFRRWTATAFSVEKYKMSFSRCGSTIEAGDVVIIYLSHDTMLPVTVKPDQISQTKYGAMKHNDLIGHPYGKKFSCTKGWVYVLQPTPELWTLCLPHRTQILYLADISMIIFQLELKPGSVVCESGTGSGSLSHAIIRSIAPTGRLHTVEFNAERHKKASAEFTEHGLAEHVSTYCRDVLQDGFPVENSADAVFLDIPQPDQAISLAAKALKKSGGRFCSFSPCMEQTQRTCTALSKPRSGFFNIETIELVRRSYNVKRVFVPVADIGLTNDGCKQAIVSAEGEHRTLPCAYETGDVLPLGDVVVRTTADPGEPASGNKRIRTERGVGEGKAGPEKGRTSPAATKYAFACRTCVTPKELAGHTGYLTFASFRRDVSLHDDDS